MKLIMGNNNGISLFYASVMQELFLIIDVDNLKDHDNNIILILEYELYSMKTNNKGPLEKLDEEMKKVIITHIQKLELAISNKVKEYSIGSQKKYNKEPDLQFLYISVQKTAKVKCQEKFADKLKILKIFYARYLELEEWTEKVKIL